MKKNLLLVFLTFTLALAFLAVGAIGAEEKKIEAPEVITIETQGLKKDKKGPVIYHHKKHQEEYLNIEGKKPIACTECHHDYQDQGGKKVNVWKEGQHVRKCNECHDPNKSDGKKKKIQLAMHKNCKECHKALVKAKKVKKAPYKKCTDCHQKK
ncbi:MAG: cytochrome c3 family protein [Deltaproteobacteria bacterium]|nr:cytochrome c3 family protein [Deltaproteobacteria bacterium]MBW2136644.1 cytochrome c3 family protein [Deltaproteobacteria bacterium]